MSRSTAGYLASHEPHGQFITQTLATFDRVMPARVQDSLLNARNRIGAVQRLNAETRRLDKDNHYPSIPTRKAKWSDKGKGTQRSLMSDINMAGINAVLKCYETSKDCSNEQVARFISKIQGHYHLFIWANQQFRPNRLTREEHRFALCELIGMEQPTKPICGGCGKAHPSGMLRHSLSCAHRGGKGIVGKFAKTGVQYGARRAFLVRVPENEPLYTEFAYPPKVSTRKTVAYVKKKADIEVSFGGRTYLVDVATTGTFPHNMHACEARKRGFIAERREQIKICETIGWTKKRNVEFVPFAIDIYGGVASRAVKFKTDLQNHAKAQNAAEKRIFNTIHPARFWEQVNIQVIKGCYSASHDKVRAYPE